MPKVGKYVFPSFRRKPESRLFEHLQNVWTPVFTGVTTSYEAVNYRSLPQVFFPV